MSSRRGLTLAALVVLAVFSALPPRDGQAAAGPQITGVWACEATRPGSAVARPLTFVFHSDGIFAYSSQTTISGGALGLPFTGRAGAYGEWKKIGPNDYAYRSIENMYIDGNAGGFFYVDGTVHLDAKSRQLCSGRPECPTAETKIRLTQFVFAPDGSITGEHDLLPANSEAIVVCSRLSAVFTGLP